MNNTIDLDDLPNAKAVVMNRARRLAAHTLLDKMLDSVDDVRDEFGAVVVEMQYKDGHFQRVKTRHERTY
jgi:hypothetical protein